MTAILTSGLIMVHVQDAAVAARVGAVAAPLCARARARLTGLHVIPPIQVYADAAIAVGTDYTQSQVAFFREDADRARDAFAAAMRDAEQESEWLEVNGGARPLIGMAAGACRVADLIVAPQAGMEDRLLPNPADLVIESGRPTLVVPAAGSFSDVGERVLIAWNGSREAARALFDALPLIKPGAEVRLLSIGRTAASDDTHLSAKTLAGTLAGRGFEATASHSEPDNVSVGEELLSRAADFGADMVVMGCYGHTRLRETIFGGATRELLQHMTVPVLMSH